MKILPRNRIKKSVAAAIAAVVLAGAGVVVGASVANAWQSTTYAGAVVSTTVITEPAGFVYYDTGTWQTIAVVDVPKEQFSYILARWSVSSRCRGTMQGLCSARVLVNGVEAEPATGNIVTFDEAGTYSAYKYLSFERIAKASWPAKVELQIWPRVTGAGTLAWDLVGWTFTVQALS